MPTKLGQPYPATFRGRYPHVLQEDHQLLTRFLDAHQHIYYELYFDVRLGADDADKASADPHWQRTWYDIKAYRADIIARAKDHILIAEVTNRAGPRALGQALIYYHLWLEDPKLPEKPRAAIICERTDDDILRVAKKLNILVIHA